MTSLTSDEAPMGEVLHEHGALDCGSSGGSPILSNASGRRSPSPTSCNSGCPVTSSASVVPAPISSCRSGPRRCRCQLEANITGRIEVWDQAVLWTWGGDILRFELITDGET